LVSKGFPLAERASLGCHAEFRPSAATALATAACFVECLCVPFGTRAAGGLASGEGFGRGGGEAGAGETVRGVAESGEHLGAAFGDVRRERHENVRVAEPTTPSRSEASDQLAG
jgi:hypothetical protein